MQCKTPKMPIYEKKNEQNNGKKQGIPYTIMTLISNTHMVDVHWSYGLWDDDF